MTLTAQPHLSARIKKIGVIGAGQMGNGIAHVCALAGMTVNLLDTSEEQLSKAIGVIPKDAAAGLNYGIDKVRFLAPVPAGARVRLRVVLSGVEPREGGQVVMKTLNTMEVEGSEKPALIAETLALLIPALGANRP